MNEQRRAVAATLILLFAFPFFVQAQSARQSSVSVPATVKNLSIKYGDDDTPATLKPAEQVAFLFVYGIWGLEGNCYDADMGVGRLCTLAELVNGVNAKSGETLGLTTDPAKDANYSYDVMPIGADCVIRAIPRVSGLAAFALVGSPRRSSGNFYYNPKGPDLINAVKLTEYGYEGKAFKR